MEALSTFFERLWAHVRYSAKAAVAALVPIAGELVDNLAVEMSNTTQMWLTLIAGSIAVWFTPNGERPLPSIIRM